MPTTTSQPLLACGVGGLRVEAVLANVSIHEVGHQVADGGAPADAGADVGAGDIDPRGGEGMDSGEVSGGQDRVQPVEIVAGPGDGDEATGLYHLLVSVPGENLEDSVGAG